MADYLNDSDINPEVEENHMNFLIIISGVLIVLGIMAVNLFSICIGIFFLCMCTTGKLYCYKNIKTSIGIFIFSCIVFYIYCGIYLLFFTLRMPDLSNIIAISLAIFGLFTFIVMFPRKNTESEISPE
jgi:hypothetical protein